ELTSMGTLIAFTAVCAGVLILRRTRPDLPRPFRMPAAWLFCSAGVLSCITLLSAMTMDNWMLMGVWTAIGFALYFGYGYRHSKLRQ
ncbi:MAG TPA: amino acid permease C-terminal domain-containing protein, partial [Xylella taiwanensis]